MYLKAICSYSSFCLLAFSSLAMAADNAVPNTLLEAMIVTGSREAEKITDTPATIGIVDKSVLQETKPTFIGQVLNKVPGVYLGNRGNEQNNTSIRQPLVARAVYQFLEDGIPIRPTGLFDRNALYEINMAGVERVEVLKGPASSLYGSYAIGGLLNFITASPALQPEADISLRSSTSGYRRMDVGASRSWADSGVRLSNYIANVNNGWRAHSDMNKFSLNFRHDTALGDKTIVKTTLSYNRLSAEQPGTLFATDYQQRPDFSYQTFTTRQGRATRLTSTLEHEVSDTRQMTASLYLRDNDIRRIPSANVEKVTATSGKGRRTDSTFTNVGADLRYRWDMGTAQPLRVILGLSSEYGPHAYQEDKLTIVRDATTAKYTSYTVDSRRRDYKATIKNTALYSQLEWTPVVHTRLVFGGRYDRIAYDYENRLVPSATTGAASEKRDFNHFSPKLGITHDLSPATNLYANYSQGFIPPEISALYGQLDVPDLQASTFDSYEIGSRMDLPDQNGRLDASFYHMTGKEVVVLYTIAPGNRISKNAGKTRHEGVELGYSKSFTDAWEFSLAGTFARHRYLEYALDASTNYAGYDMATAPRWIANTSVTYNPPSISGAKIALELQHLDRYWMNDSNTIRYPGHTLLNLRSEYHCGAWETWLQVLNLTDKAYAEEAVSSYNGVGAYDPNSSDTYVPGEPRTILLGLTYRFGAKKSQL